MKFIYVKLSYWKIILLILVVSLITGCWDATELANLAIVGAIGIDRDVEPGKLLITAQIIKPGEVKSGGGGEVGGGGGGDQSQQKGGSSKASLIAQSSGKTVAEAMQNFAFQLNREIYLPDNQIIILGKELAAQGVRSMMDFFIRTRETRETAWIVIANGKASEILDSQTRLEKIPAREITGLITNRDTTSESVGVIQQEFVNRLMSKSASPYASMVEASGEPKKVQLIGTAVFKHDKFVGELDKVETRGFLWVTGKVNRGVMTVNLPKGGQIDFGIIKAQSKVSAELSSQKPVIKVEVVCLCDVNSETIPEDFTKEKTMNRLQRLLSQAIRKEIRRAILKTHQLDCDIFGFGEVIHRENPKKWKVLEPIWDRAFLNTPIQLKVKAKLVEIGLNIKPAVPQ